MDLVSKHCVPCEGGTKPLDKKDIQKYQAVLTISWEVLEDKKIKHEFKFKDFKQAIEFVNKVAKLAQEEGHHPDIHIFFNKVTLELWTHAIDGLSENDFILAAKINNLVK